MSSDAPSTPAPTTDPEHPLAGETLGTQAGSGSTDNFVTKFAGRKQRSTDNFEIKSDQQRGKRVTLAGTLTAALAAGAWLLAGGSAATAVAQGDPCPNADIRSQQNAEFLPDCRAYEQASPVDKNGGHVGVGGVAALEGALTSPDGNRVFYKSDAAFPGSLAADVTNVYVSAREGDGWQTFPITAPYTFDQVTYTSKVRGTSPDLSVQLVESNDALTPGATQGELNGYIYDSSTGSYEFLGSVTKNGQANFFYQGGSADGSRMFFKARQGALDSTPPPPGNQAMYEFSNGELKLIGVLPDGTVSPTLARTAIPVGGGERVARNPISNDGSRVYWQNANSPAPLYLSEDGEETVLITERESDGSTQAAEFGHATPDGDYAFIFSDDRLTDDASPGVNEEQLVTVGGGATGGTFTLSLFVSGSGTDTTAPIAWDASAAAVQSALEALSNADAGDVSVTGAAGGPWTVEFTGALGGTGMSTLGQDASGLTPSGTVTVTTPVQGVAPMDLYRYDAEADELTSLTPTAAATGGGVEGVLGVSEDGSYVYFQATGDLAPGATEGEHNIYAWHDGEIRLVATSAAGLERAFGGVGQSEDPFGPRDNWRVSPDGGHLGLTIAGALTGPNPQPAQTFRQAYLYSYEDDTLDCASCPPGGAEPTGYVQMGMPIGGSSDMQESEGLARAVLDDGSLFFASPDSLVGGDSNGKRDVYQYRAGEVHLISTGQSPDDSFLGDVTADGSSVFVLTTSQLVGQDQDALYDYYSARVDGGLASQNPPPEDPPCQGDECQGESTAPPADTDPNTDKSGSGNPAAIDRERCQKLERKATNTKKRSKKLAKKAKKLKKKARKANGKKKSKRLKKKARKKTKKSRKQAQKSRKFVLRAVKCRGGSQ